MEVKSVMARKMRRKIKTKQATKELMILLGSSIISLILLFLALFVFKVFKNIKTLIIPGPISIILPYNVDFINLMVLFILILITPYAVYKYMVFRRKKRVEMLMPVLLYDLAGLVRAGHTVPKALEIELEKDLGPLNELLEKALNKSTEALKILYNLSRSAFNTLYKESSSKGFLWVKPRLKKPLELAGKAEELFKTGKYPDALKAMKDAIDLLVREKGRLEGEVKKAQTVMFSIVGVAVAVGVVLWLRRRRPC